ncbi:hypothetical protein WJX74_002191 [Apatococcus lobatus]|uniref:Uncharacterized protein n=1 Tax=Apatococcus lobatus TaxID=904363 RepID=A0AAW1RV94_9CHLO
MHGSQSTLLKLKTAASPDQDARPEGLSALKQRYGRLGLSLSPEARSSSLQASVAGDRNTPQSWLTWHQSAAEDADVRSEDQSRTPLLIQDASGTPQSWLTSLEIKSHGHEANSEDPDRSHFQTPGKDMQSVTRFCSAISRMPSGNDSPASVSKPPRLTPAMAQLREDAPATSPAASPSPASWLVPSTSGHDRFPSPVPPKTCGAASGLSGSMRLSQIDAERQTGCAGASQAPDAHASDSQHWNGGLSMQPRANAEAGMMEETGESELGGPDSSQYSAVRDPFPRPVASKLSESESAQHMTSQAADAGSAVKPRHDAPSIMHGQGNLEHGTPSAQAPVRASLPLLRGARGSAAPLTPVSEWAPLRGRFNSAIPRPSSASTQSHTSSCLRGTEGPTEPELRMPSSMAEALITLPHVTTHSPSQATHPATRHGSWQAAETKKARLSTEWAAPSDKDRQAVRHVPLGEKHALQTEQQAAHPATIRDAWRMQKGVPRQGGLLGRGLLHGRDPMSPCPMQDVRLSQAMPRGIKAPQSGGASRRRPSGLGHSRPKMQPHMVQPPWVGPAEEGDAGCEPTSDGNAKPQGPNSDLVASMHARLSRLGLPLGSQRGNVSMHSPIKEAPAHQPQHQAGDQPSTTIVSASSQSGQDASTWLTSAPSPKPSASLQSSQVESSRGSIVPAAGSALQDDDSQEWLYTPIIGSADGKDSNAVPGVGACALPVSPGKFPFIHPSASQSWATDPSASAQSTDVATSHGAAGESSADRPAQPLTRGNPPVPRQNAAPPNAVSGVGSAARSQSDMLEDRLGLGISLPLRRSNAEGHTISPVGPHEDAAQSNDTAQCMSGQEVLTPHDPPAADTSTAGMQLAEAVQISMPSHHRSESSPASWKSQSFHQPPGNKENLAPLQHDVSSPHSSMSHAASSGTKDALRSPQSHHVQSSERKVVTRSKVRLQGSTAGDGFESPSRASPDMVQAFAEAVACMRSSPSPCVSPLRQPTSLKKPANGSVARPAGHTSPLVSATAKCQFDSGRQSLCSPATAIRPTKIALSNLFEQSVSPAHELASELPQPSVSRSPSMPASPQAHLAAELLEDQIPIARGTSLEQQVCNGSGDQPASLGAELHMDSSGQSSPSGMQGTVDAADDDPEYALDWSIPAQTETAEGDPEEDLATPSPDSLLSLSAESLDGLTDTSSDRGAHKPALCAAGYLTTPRITDPQERPVSVFRQPLALVASPTSQNVGANSWIASRGLTALFPQAGGFASPIEVKGKYQARQQAEAQSQERPEVVRQLVPGDSPHMYYARAASTPGAASPFNLTARSQELMRLGTCQPPSLMTPDLQSQASGASLQGTTSGRPARPRSFSRHGACCLAILSTLLVAAFTALWQALSAGPAWWSLRARGPPSMSTLEKAYADLERRLAVEEVAPASNYATASAHSGLPSDGMHLTEDAEDQLPAWAQLDEQVEPQPKPSAPWAVADPPPASHPAKQLSSDTQQRESRPYMAEDAADEVPACTQSTARVEAQQDSESSATPAGIFAVPMGLDPEDQLLGSRGIAAKSLLPETHAQARSQAAADPDLQGIHGSANSMPTAFENAGRSWLEPSFGILSGIIMACGAAVLWAVRHLCWRASKHQDPGALALHARQRRHAECKEAEDDDEESDADHAAVSPQQHLPVQPSPSSSRYNLRDRAGT